MTVSRVSEDALSSVDSDQTPKLSVVQRFRLFERVSDLGVTSLSEAILLFHLVRGGRAHARN